MRKNSTKSPDPSQASSSWLGMIRATYPFFLRRSKNFKKSYFGLVFCFNKADIPSVKPYWGLWQVQDERMKG
ncbi:MAG: hypothetical protein ACXAC5_03645 [Promethearchaeota archaeon]